MALRKIFLTVGSDRVGRAITWSYPNSDGNSYEIPTYPLTVTGKDDKDKTQTKQFEVIRFGVNRKSGNKEQARIVGLADWQVYTISAWLPTYSVHSYADAEVGAWQVFGDYLIHDGPDKPLQQAYATAGCIEICKVKFYEFNDFIMSLSGSTKLTKEDKLKQIGSSQIMKITYLKADRPPLKLWKN